MNRSYQWGLLASAAILSASLSGMPQSAAAQTAQGTPADIMPPERPTAGNQAQAEDRRAVKPVLAPPVGTPAEITPLFLENNEVVQPVTPAVQTWTVTQAGALVELIKGIGSEGLDPRDYDLAELQAAIAAGPGARLNMVASRSFTFLIEDMRDGRTPMDARRQWFVVDPDPDRYRTADVMQEALKGGDIAAALKSVTPLHPDYGILKAELARTPKADTKRRKLIRANMDRWRWLGRDLGGQYLMTNVPEYQLRLTVNDKIISTYRTIVGKPGRTATPQLAESVEGVIFNPNWTVPQSIVKGEGLGAKVLNNPAWAKRAGYVATKGENGWVSVVQQPGPTNSLGRMKLDMPNEHAIFLHDTPNRNLFSQSNRALSHGCIRTERASELAITMAMLQAGLSAEEGVEHNTSGKYTRVGFDKTMPVYITYFTMARDIDGKLATFDDIYDRDAPVLAALDKPRIANRARVTDEEVVPLEAPGA